MGVYIPQANNFMVTGFILMCKYILPLSKKSDRADIMHSQCLLSAHAIDMVVSLRILTLLARINLQCYIAEFVAYMKSIVSNILIN